MYFVLIFEKILVLYWHSVKGSIISSTFFGVSELKEPISTRLENLGASSSSSRIIGAGISGILARTFVETLAIPARNVQILARIGHPAPFLQCVLRLQMDY